MKQFLRCVLAILSLAAPAGAQTDSVDAFVRDFIQRHNIHFALNLTLTTCFYLFRSVADFAMHQRNASWGIT